jgi:hypothetical protein
MAVYDEVKAFLLMAEDALQDPVATSAQNVRSLPEPLQLQLAKAIRAVAKDRYDKHELRRAADEWQRAGDLVSCLRKLPGGLGEAIKALNYVLADNDAFAF